LKTSSKTLKWATIILIVTYLAGPIVAAALRYSDRRGPVIYPKAYHEIIFIIAHEAFHDGEKPRLPIHPGERPWFY